MLRFSKTLPMFAVIMTLWICQTSFGQQAFDNWKISLGADGRTVSMTYSNPATFLNIESEFALDVDNAGEPVKGTIKFKNGFQRAMSPEEVNYYFEQYKGDRAYWDYSQAQGKITNFTSQTDQIPFGFLGRKARVLTTAGNTYIGTLGVNANTPAWFALDIRGNHILFYRQVVKEIQQLK
jgi:hypothetical protein